MEAGIMSESERSFTAQVMEQAAHVLASIFRPGQHSQLCPVWVHKQAIGECDCWILREARAAADALATARLLRQPTPEPWRSPC